MQVLRSIEELSPLRACSVVTVGNYDGVHRGHSYILDFLKRDAAARGCEPAVVTFDPHPSRVLRPQSAPLAITPLPIKIELLQRAGIARVAVLPFDDRLLHMSPREFVETVLVRGARARAVHEGANFRFGYRHAGDVDTLRDLGREFGFEVVVHSDLHVGREMVSSSRVRELIAAGDVGAARRMLGRVFSVRGEIARGKGIGRKLTVPTLNLAPYYELLPRNGVYATRTVLEGRSLDSVSNVGVRPTFNGNETRATLETHLLDFEPIEASTMEVEFYYRLRDEKKFENPAALREQIGRDVARVRSYFSKLTRAKVPAARSR